MPEGARDAIAEIVEVTHSGTPPFAQAGALAALGETEFVAGFRQHCAEGRHLAPKAWPG